MITLYTICQRPLPIKRAVLQVARSSVSAYFSNDAPQAVPAVSPAQTNPQLENVPHYMTLSNALRDDHFPEAADLVRDMVLYEDFLTEAEESSIVAELEPHLKRMRYEFDHWDDAIHGFRETERLRWNADNSKILDRVRELAFAGKGVAPLQHVHVLDLAKDGHIKPHIDAVRFCGNTIAGLSLLTDSVMRLVRDKDHTRSLDVLLARRSLYIMRDSARYNYTHEILAEAHSTFRDRRVPKDRRISVICRNEPRPQDATA